MATWAQGIGVIELFYEDLATAKSFYQDVFGLPVDREDDTSVSFLLGDLVVILLCPSAASELIEPAVVAAPDAGSRKCFTIGVDNVDAVCADLTSRGVELLTGPVNRWWGRRTANFADPGGHLYEIASPLPSGGVAPATGPVSWEKEIGVIELFYDDLAAAKAFYQDVFGLPVDGEDETSVSFALGDMVLGLLSRPAASELIDPVRVAPPDAGARMCATIGVDDVDAVCAQLSERGVKIIAGPYNRRWGPRSAYFADPGGHIYEIAS
jgi:catechol 2,3-dioxygenase-like lactoylglutathione lyase family enzyme